MKINIKMLGFMLVCIITILSFRNPSHAHAYIFSNTSLSVVQFVLNSITSAFSLPSISNFTFQAAVSKAVQSEIITAESLGNPIQMRNLKFDTLGKTLLLEGTAPDRNGRLYELSAGTVIKNWRVKYEKKGT